MLSQCAAAQGGSYTNGRHAWQHSMLIDPWNKIVAILPEGQGTCAGRLDLFGATKLGSVKIVCCKCLFCIQCF